MYFNQEALDEIRECLKEIKDACDRIINSTPITPNNEGNSSSVPISSAIDNHEDSSDVVEDVPAKGVTVNLDKDSAAAEDNGSVVLSSKDYVVVCHNQGSHNSVVQHKDMGLPSNYQAVVEDLSIEFEVVCNKQVIHASARTIDSAIMGDFVDQVEVPIAWFFGVKMNEHKAGIMPRCIQVLDNVVAMEMASDTSGQVCRSLSAPLMMSSSQIVANIFGVAMISGNNNFPGPLIQSQRLLLSELPDDHSVETNSMLSVGYVSRFIKNVIENSTGILHDAQYYRPACQSTLLKDAYYNIVKFSSILDASLHYTVKVPCSRQDVTFNTKRVQWCFKGGTMKNFPRTDMQFSLVQNSYISGHISSAAVLPYYVKANALVNQNQQFSTSLKAARHQHNITCMMFQIFWIASILHSDVVFSPSTEVTVNIELIVCPYSRTFLLWVAEMSTVVLIQGILLWFKASSLIEFANLVLAVQILLVYLVFPIVQVRPISVFLAVAVHDYTVHKFLFFASVISLLQGGMGVVTAIYLTPAVNSVFLLGVHHHKCLLVYAYQGVWRLADSSGYTHTVDNLYRIYHLDHIAQISDLLFAKCFMWCLYFFDPGITRTLQCVSNIGDYTYEGQFIVLQSSAAVEIQSAKLASFRVSACTNRGATNSVFTSKCMRSSYVNLSIGSPENNVGKRGKVCSAHRHSYASTHEGVLQSWKMISACINLLQLWLCTAEFFCMTLWKIAWGSVLGFSIASFRVVNKSYTFSTGGISLDSVNAYVSCTYTHLHQAISVAPCIHMKEILTLFGPRLPPFQMILKLFKGSAASAFIKDNYTIKDNYGVDLYHYTQGTDISHTVTLRSTRLDAMSHSMVLHKFGCLVQDVDSLRRSTDVVCSSGYVVRQELSGLVFEPGGQSEWEECSLVVAHLLNFLWRIAWGLNQLLVSRFCYEYVGYSGQSGGHESLLKFLWRIAWKLWTEYGPLDRPILSAILEDKDPF